MNNEIEIIYKIVVRELASKDIVYTEDYVGDRFEMERRASHIWNHPYASSPNRFRLYVHEKGKRSAILTIG